MIYQKDAKNVSMIWQWSQAASLRDATVNEESCESLLFSQDNSYVWSDTKGISIGSG